MRAHVLDDVGVIINTIEVTDIDCLPRLADAAIGGAIGDAIVDGVLVPAQPALVDASPPVIVTMRQARLALMEVGLLDTVEDAIAAIPDDMQRTRAQIEWGTARDVERNNEVAMLIAGAVGLGGVELDELFRLAATL